MSARILWILMAGFSSASLYAAKEEVDVRTFDGSDDSRVLACKAAKDSANEWARSSTSRIWDETSTEMGDCDCEEVELDEAPNDVIADLEKSFGMGGSYHVCIVELTVYAEED